ncbi:MAG: hypothetical protein JW982_01825 [Spirochaetes bacterium]|nr:hypothetical protein [Spirochaetota bacterium]
MPENCALCKKETQAGKEWIIVTAKSRTKYEIGPGIHSQYSDFITHSFEVCADCTKKRIIAIIISSAVLITIFVVGEKINGRSLWAIPLYIALILSIGILYFGRITGKIKKLAIQNRKLTDDVRIKAFTLNQFQKLEPVKK